MSWPRTRAMARQLKASAPQTRVSELDKAAAQLREIVAKTQAQLDESNKRAIFSGAQQAVARAALPLLLLLLLLLLPPPLLLRRPHAQRAGSALEHAAREQRLAADLETARQVRRAAAIGGQRVRARWVRAAQEVESAKKQLADTQQRLGEVLALSSENEEKFKTAVRARAARAARPPLVALADLRIVASSAQVELSQEIEAKHYSVVEEARQTKTQVRTACLYCLFMPRRLCQRCCTCSCWRACPRSTNSGSKRSSSCSRSRMRRTVRPGYVSVQHPDGARLSTGRPQEYEAERKSLQDQVAGLQSALDAERTVMAVSACARRRSAAERRLTARAAARQSLRGDLQRESQTREAAQSDFRRELSAHANVGSASSPPLPGAPALTEDGGNAGRAGGGRAEAAAHRRAAGAAGRARRAGWRAPRRCRR